MMMMMMMMMMRTSFVYLHHDYYLSEIVNRLIIEPVTASFI